MKANHQIIYLNGPSSSGKTTLAKALQQAFEQPYLHIGLDRVIGMMPDKLNNWEGEPAPLGFSWKSSADETGHIVQEIQTGPFAEKMIQTFMEIVLSTAKIGHYIIIDDVSFGKCQVDTWREVLNEFKVLWIGINAPLDILEQREQARGNRILGSARAQHLRIHQGMRYDLEFETHRDSLEIMVHKILES